MPDERLTVDTQAPAPPLSLRAYARRRGVSPEAVSRAVKNGRLSRSVVRVEGAPKIADPGLADREWDENTDLSRAPLTVVERAGQRERRLSQTMAARFRIVALPELGIVEVDYHPTDPDELEDAFTIGLDTDEARWLGERLLAASRRTPPF